MKQVLANYLNKIIEVSYGGATSIRGKLLDIIDEVAVLEDEDKITVFVAIDKISVFWETKDKEKSVGFLSKPKVKSEA